MANFWTNLINRIDVNVEVSIVTLKSPRRRKWKKRRIFRCTSLKQTPLQLDGCDFPWQFMRPIVCHCCMNESMTHIPLVKTKQSYRLLHRLLRIEPWCAGIMTLNMRLWNRGFFFFFARTLNVITHYFTEKQTKSQNIGTLTFQLLPLQNINI